MITMAMFNTKLDSYWKGHESALERYSSKGITTDLVEGLSSLANKSGYLDAERFKDADHDASVAVRELSVLEKRFSNRKDYHSLSAEIKLLVARKGLKYDTTEECFSNIRAISETISSGKLYTLHPDDCILVLLAKHICALDNLASHGTLTKECCGMIQDSIAYIVEYILFLKERLAHV